MQHGFVKKKSCTTNLLETIDFITWSINGIPVDVVLLDFAKAFVTVAHKRLMLEIDKIEINKNFSLVNNNLRGHCLMYNKEVARVPSREHFFFNRIANLWNSLPNEVVTALSVDNFKAALDCWLMSNQA